LEFDFQFFFADANEQQMVFLGHMQGLRRHFRFFEDATFVLAVESNTGLQASLHWQELESANLTHGCVEMREDKGKGGSGLRTTPESKYAMIKDMNCCLVDHSIAISDDIYTVSSGKNGDALVSELKEQLMQFSWHTKPPKDVYDLNLRRVASGKGSDRSMNDDMAMAAMINRYAHSVYNSAAGRMQYHSRVM